MKIAHKRALLLAAIGCNLAGCLTPSAISVLFDVELAVTGTRADGSVWHASAAEILKGKPSPKEFDPYGPTIFRRHDFEVSFVVIKNGFGVELTNLTSMPVCFRFDLARLSSNFDPAPKVLRSMPEFREGEYSRMTAADWERRLATGALPMNKVCVEPGFSKPVYSFDNRIASFPSGKMFNVSYPKDAPVLNPDGVGNWAKLHLPIEFGSRREDVEFKLTARQSRARAMYY